MNMNYIMNSGQELMESSDDSMVKHFVRVYHKTLASFANTSHQTWTADQFEPVYDALVQFTAHYPRQDPLFANKSKMDILRCHVTLCNKFVRKFPAVAKQVVNGKPSGNVIHERITREMMSAESLSDEKVLNIHLKPFKTI